MKLNPDCIRDILLHVENFSFGQTENSKDLINSLAKYNGDEIVYTCAKLNEANLIEATFRKYPSDDKLILLHVDDLTYEGHQFVANIHEDTVWNGVKSVAKKVGTSSINGLIQIASNVITTLIKSQFGLNP